MKLELRPDWKENVIAVTSTMSFVAFFMLSAIMLLFFVLTHNTLWLWLFMALYWAGATNLFIFENMIINAHEKRKKCDNNDT